MTVSTYRKQIRLRVADVMAESPTERESREDYVDVVLNEGESIKVESGIATTYTPQIALPYTPLTKTPNSNTRNLITPTDNYIPLAIQSDAGQTENLFEVYESDGSTILFALDPDGLPYMQEVTTPSTPASGYWLLYFTSAGLKWIDDVGTEYSPLTNPLSVSLNCNGNDLTDVGNVTFKTGATSGTLRTGTSAADKFQLQAYDVDGSAYKTIMHLDAGNDPYLDLDVDYVYFSDDADSSKKVRFGVSAITTATERTVDWPDRDGTIFVDNDGGTVELKMHTLQFDSNDDGTYSYIAAYKQSTGNPGYLAMYSQGAGNAGYVSTYATNAGGDGGNIDTHGGGFLGTPYHGGDILTYASGFAHGGSFISYAGSSDGGDVDTHGGGGSLSGGDIDTSAGGGSITTNTSQGNIEFSISGYRATVQSHGVASATTHTLPAATGTLLTDTTSITEDEVLLAGSTRGTVKTSGFKHFGKLTTANEPSSGMSDGDQYYNTDLNECMYYDATYSEWLSVATYTAGGGYNGTASTSTMLRGFNGTPYTSTRGVGVPKAKIVAIGFTQSTAAAAVIALYNNGSSAGTWTSSGSAGTEYADGLDTDIAEGNLTFQNDSTSVSISYPQVWAYYKKRA